jgi:hypothetical protein
VSATKAYLVGVFSPTSCFGFKRENGDLDKGQANGVARARARGGRREEREKWVLARSTIFGPAAPGGLAQQGVPARHPSCLGLPHWHGCRTTCTSTTVHFCRARRAGASKELDSEIKVRRG